MGLFSDGFKELKKASEPLYKAPKSIQETIERDKLGIVPEHVIPSYCEAWFPGMDILDFMNLPYEQDEYELMLPKITWLEEQEQKLLKKN